jgi:hypothetical protein
MKYLFFALLASCTMTQMEMKVEKPKPSVDAILNIVKESSCKDYKWKDRGRAPIGYMNGMSLVFAKNHCKPLKTFGTKSKVDGGLEYYGIEKNSVSAFNLLLGLGMRESSGKYCCGRDMTNPTTYTSTGAEAGSHQTSYNAAYSVQVNGNPAAADEMRALLPAYQKDKSKCFLDVFKEGVSQSYCTGGNAKNWGEGIGLEYQVLSKECPTFHVEFTLLTMLNTKSHYGPLKTKAAEYNLTCEKMFKDIAAYLDFTNCDL